MNKEELNNLVRQTREEHDFRGQHLDYYLTTETNLVIEGERVNLEGKDYTFLPEKELLIIKRK